MASRHTASRHVSAPKQSKTIRLLWQLILSGLLAAVVFSHLNAFGCTGSHCPDIDALPHSPLQLLLFRYVPKAMKMAEYTNKIACDKGFLSAKACQNLYGISFVASLVEWTFLGLTGTRILAVLLKMKITRLITLLLLFFASLYFFTAVVETYLSELLPQFLLNYNVLLKDWLSGGVLFSSGVLNSFLKLWRDGQDQEFPKQALFSAFRKMAGVDDAQPSYARLSSEL
ncbi:putative transmembrane protein [Gregarina niphandrodes]|uniref:Transmembrane protein n=1 Tax=Gregarina niphandrodes TaxID=110365 RepID=A0A023AXF7_GRENI|nr:putative transmembrane protein [Gregarina niphandrodes]EZG43312.1 putative transmembrane protein [Gregarina niphandrodes]|eukprot:XP_011133431.1 putative transmembrane protein [Gregarina niphandrodes]